MFNLQSKTAPAPSPCSRSWNFPRLQPIAAKLLQPNEPDAIRVATIKLLGQQRDAKVADLLLEAWPTLTPAPREAALQALASKPALTGALLTAIEQGRIKPAEISPTARTLLTRDFRRETPRARHQTLRRRRHTRGSHREVPERPRRSRATPTPVTRFTRPPAPCAIARATRAATSARTSRRC